VLGSGERTGRHDPHGQTDPRDIGGGGIHGRADGDARSRTSVGLEVGDAPHAGPDGNPSPGHTTGEPQSVLAGIITSRRKIALKMNEMNIRLCGNKLGCQLADKKSTHMLASASEPTRPRTSHDERGPAEAAVPNEWRDVIDGMSC
jgi:hypothetical protein